MYLFNVTDMTARAEFEFCICSVLEELHVIGPVRVMTARAGELPGPGLRFYLVFKGMARLSKTAYHVGFTAYSRMAFKAGVVYRQVKLCNVRCGMCVMAYHAQSR